MQSLGLLVFYDIDIFLRFDGGIKIEYVLSYFLIN